MPILHLRDLFIQILKSTEILILVKVSTNFSDKNAKVFMHSQKVI